MSQAKIILTTERLILRNWIDQDVDKMAAISADPQVMAYFPQPQSFEEAKTFIANIKSQYQRYGYSLYAVELKQTYYRDRVALSHCPLG